MPRLEALETICRTFEFLEEGAEAKWCEDRTQQMLALFLVYKRMYILVLWEMFHVAQVQAALLHPCSLSNRILLLPFGLSLVALGTVINSSSSSHNFDNKIANALSF